MGKDNQVRPKVALVLFVAIVLINWLYVLWARSQFEVMLSGWFVVTPLLGYFYFFFAFVASIALYKRMTTGLSLAYGIILFGIVAAVISYNTAFKADALLGLMIVPLIVLNVFVACYIAFNQMYFKLK